MFLVQGFNRNIGTVVFFLAEHYHTIDESEQGVVFTNTYVQTGVMYCTSLTHDDVTGFSGLSAIYLYS